MKSETLYLIASDALLIAHTLFVLFIVFGLLLIIAGKVWSWSWVRNPWFRLAHLGGIGIVVLQSWLGEICPLTRWEMTLRYRSGESGYSGTFIGHWLETLLYYSFPEWIFTFAYTAFAAAVLAAWFWVPPRSFHRHK